MAAFVAGLARGFSGFGAALIFVPLASAVVGPRMAGPILLVIDIVASFPLIPDAFGKADKQAVGLMSMGAVVAVPLGVLALMHFDPLATRWGISLTAIGFLCCCCRAGAIGPNRLRQPRSASASSPAFSAARRNSAGRRS
ncbi:sulfite exporter TauE/SafE family protein [Rhizobium sp. G21]|uniref:sulfite exporter TauE/SafE family protein n=1 Tax=Rhizobium sp. G21 TaxID=2758439 RepID=UPI0028AD87BF|nr:sulfite exporter TauE/SafE family protein [Rhizobium sp. G21]